MAVFKKGADQELMLSLFKKETAFDTTVTMNDTNACSMQGFESIDPDHADEVVNDKDEVTGSEFGTDSMITTKAAKIMYSEPKAKPNSVAGIGALVLGDITSTKDGAQTAYSHEINPVAVGTALASITGEHKKGGIQTKYTGLKGNSITLAGEAGGLLSLKAELIGSGTRASSATAFAAKISESWMKISQCKVWLESGAAISIDAAPAQNAESISSGTPTDLKALFKSFEWTFNNNLERQIGFGSDVAQDIDSVRRAVELKFALQFPASGGSTYQGYFDNQNPVAIEFDLVGAQIDGGTMYYGIQLIVPRFKLKAQPVAKGGVSDYLTMEFDCDVQDDGTNPVSVLWVYNQQAAYIG